MNTIILKLLLALFTPIVNNSHPTPENIKRWGGGVHFTVIKFSAKIPMLRFWVSFFYLLLPPPKKKLKWGRPLQKSSFEFGGPRELLFAPPQKKLLKWWNFRKKFFFVVKNRVFWQKIYFNTFFLTQKVTKFSSKNFKTAFFYL